MDFYQFVPKDLAANLEFRIKLRKRALRDHGVRRKLITACRHDVLFFFNAFCWLYEPRPKVVNGRQMPAVIPFISWIHQDPAIREIKANLGLEDIGGEKSRGEGASWIACLLATHDWLFEPMTAIGMVSRNELAVDNPEDPDSLFWKIDWELTQLPGWMVPRSKRNLSEHTLRNLDNGSTITGYSAVGDVASGGRKKWFLMDELAKFPRGPDKEAMASTQHVTNSRLVISTPKGSEGAYYDLMHEPSSMVKVVLDWKQNPTRNRGLYKFKDGKPEAVDPANPLPPHYDPPSQDVLDLFSRLRRKGFKLEGVERSPWYDHECDRPGATPQNIAQELDRDYGGSMYRIFGSDFFDRAEKEGRAPFTRGILNYHPRTFEPEFDKSDDGPGLLWTRLDYRNQPPRHAYAIGADVASGLGGSFSSNSVVTVLDMNTMEQVFEYASNTIAPSEFAEYCIALAKWFHGAYLAWEHNGPGSGFTKRAIAIGYPNVYRRESLWRSSKKKTKEIGWWTDTRSKEAMFDELRRAVTTGELKLRCREAIRECGQYVRVNGKIVHIGSTSTEDESSKGEAHGDRVIALAVALQAVRDRPLSRGLWEREASTPRKGILARQREYEASLRAKDSDWDGRTDWDLAHSA